MGRLGWTSDQALDATPPQIEMALRARGDFIGEILKAVFGSPKEDEEAKKLAEQKPTPEIAAQQLMAFFKRRHAREQRDAKKKNA